ncbi:MAG TPA: thioredoxin-like domain-containing protein [Blastocatellia bacterium]|nr:thioredoxin-like domain-containing protein [Blastocatellia bacterium]
MPDYRGKVNAPDFPADIDWLNTDRPLSLHELRGKIVLLDFWTYCCINCMHIIPDLKRLEKKYPNELVVIGVHSAKFRTERETENIRQAILRYEIEHPVVNDWQMRVWNSYAVRSWPSLVLIDPEGKIVGGLSGEGIYEPLDTAISEVIKRSDAEKKLDRTPLKLKLERHRAPSSLLAFPGKVLADPATKQLFIADSNHNRIVVVSLRDSSVTDVIGTGEVGISDGEFGKSTFNHPQGMAFDGKLLYVADTENHAVRIIDLEKRFVTTLAGNGEQGPWRNAGGPVKQVKLSSPWDLVLNNDVLYIAMAGTHQLWQIDLKRGIASPYAGSGREARLDGPLDQAALAQPSGITTDGKRLYFADSEVSSIRAADLAPNGKVESLAGGGDLESANGGAALFEYGDQDAKAFAARFQHPLGVAYHDGAVYVADTYNNKIKRVSLDKRSSETFVGTGEAGYVDGKKAKLDEPSGVSIADGKLYIADTNNHLIRVADLKSKQVETLRIKGLEKLRPTMRLGFRGESVELPSQAVEPGDIALAINLELPKGFKLNPQAPSFVKVTSPERRLVSFKEGEEFSAANPQFPISVPVTVSEGDGGITIELTLYYCEAEKETLCYFKEVRMFVPIKAKKGAGSARVEVSYQLKLS